jgi:LacI family transcriptional regulator
MTTTVRSKGDGRRRRAPESRPPTLQDVARAAGVSTATVSRCLRHPEKVRPVLKERVDAAIADLAYTPHGAARALATRRSHTIGAVVPTLHMAIFAYGVQGLQDRLVAADYTPLLALSNFDLEEEYRNATSLVSRGIDGLMLVGIEHDPRLLDLLDRKGIPLINTWKVDADDDRPCIGIDNRAALRHITRFVLDMGHRDVAMIVGGLDHINDRSRDRAAGFRDALVGRRLNPDRIVEKAYGIAGGREVLRALMAEPEPPTAIVCGSDLFALGALLECRRLGIEVPRELSITGVDDLEIAAQFVPALTTVHVPARQIGERAADYLLARLDGRPVVDKTELECDLIVRETVAPPRGA